MRKLNERLQNGRRKFLMIWAVIITFKVRTVLAIKKTQESINKVKAIRAIDHNFYRCIWTKVREIFLSAAEIIGKKSHFRREMRWAKTQSKMQPIKNSLRRDRTPLLLTPIRIWLGIKETVSPKVTKLFNRINMQL